MDKTLMAGYRRRINDASSVLFQRLPYMLSPQLDIYENLGPLVEGKRVLEIGFGTGLGTLQYSGSASMIDAIEIDPAAVRFAIRCFGHEKISWFDGDITDWDSEGIDYDFVVMIEVLEHIEFANIALSRVVSLLRPEGRALITVPNKLRERQKDDPLIVHEWKPEEFSRLLSDHFEQVEFLDFNLKQMQDPFFSMVTPLIALCS